MPTMNLPIVPETVKDPSAQPGLADIDDACVTRVLGVASGLAGSYCLGVIPVGVPTGIFFFPVLEGASFAETIRGATGCAGVLMWGCTVSGAVASLLSLSLLSKAAYSCYQSCTEKKDSELTANDTDTKSTARPEAVELQSIEQETGIAARSASHDHIYSSGERSSHFARSRPSTPKRLAREPGELQPLAADDSGISRYTQPSQ